MSGKRLSDQERSVILALHRRGVPAEQIAEQSGRSLRTVYTVMARAAEMRRCSDCGEFQPTTEAFYRDRTRTAKTGRESFMRICKECHKRRVRERERRRKDDPQQRERFIAERRRWQKDWRKRNRERVRRYWAAYYARLRRDPERWRAYLEDQRIDYRLRRERQGHPLADPGPGGSKTGGMLPIGPFLRNVVEPAYHEARFVLDAGRPGELKAAGSIEEYVANLLGTHERQVWRWREESAAVSAEVAERAWNALGLNWWDVYEPGDEGYERAARIFGDIGESEAA